MLKADVAAKQLNMISLCDASANRAKQLWCVHKNRISNRHVPLQRYCKAVAGPCVHTARKKIVSNYVIERGATKMPLVQKIISLL